MLDMEKNRKSQSLDIRLPEIYKPIWNKKRLKVFFGGRGAGRGNPVDMIIATEGGLKRFGDLTLSDRIYGSDGKFQAITGIYDRGWLDTYRVHFSDGSYLDTDKTHIWAFDYTRSDKEAKKRRIVTTDDLISIKPKDYYRWHLPLVTLTEGKKVAVNPYLVGLWLADGSWAAKRAVISKKEPNVSRFLDTFDYKHKRTGEDGVSQWSFATSHPLSKYLWNSIGHRTAKQKFIPEEFFTAPFDQRKELLHGLMDGDGRLDRRGKGYVSPQYHTSSKRLAEDVVSLICSLGGVAKKRIDSDGIYEINIYLPFNTFKYSHEAEEYAPVKDKRYGQRILSCVEYIGKKQIRCIRVANEDSLYVADKKFCILTHNTHSIARYILIRALREKLRIWCAREVQEAIWQSVHHVFCELISQYNLEQYFKITDKDITCIPSGSYFMFRGFRGSGGQYSEEGLKAYEDFDILWIEEAAACSMQSLLVVSKTIRKDGSEILASFNRVLEEDPIWRFGCYNVGDIYKNKTFEDEDRIVIYATVDDNPFASETFLKERETDKKRLDPDEYNKVWLGYPDRAGSFKAFFPRELIYREVQDVPYEEYSKYEVVCGFDPNGGGKDSACAVARQGRKILALRVFRGIKDPLELADAFIAFKREFGADRAYCDRGYGQGVLAIAASQNEIITPVDFGGRASQDTCLNKRAEMYMRLRDWLQDGGALGDPKSQDIVELRRELQSIEYNLRKSDDGKICLGSKDDIRKKLGRSPDRADAVALTFAGFKDRIIRDRYGREIDSGGGYKLETMENVNTLDLL